MTAPPAPHLRSKAAAEELLRQAEDEGRDLTDGEVAYLNRLVADYDAGLEVEERRSAVTATAGIVLPTGGPWQSLAGGAHHATPDAGTGHFPFVPTPAGIRELHRAVENYQDLRIGLLPAPREHLRSTVTLSDTGGPVGVGHGRLPEPRRLSVAVGLVPEPGDYGSRGTSGPAFAAPTSAPPTAEGSTKPEAAGIGELAIVPAALARWTDLSRHAILSQPTLLEEVTRWHALHLARDEDAQLVGALVAAAGDPVDGTADPAGTVRNSMAAIADAAASDADVVVVNPADYSLVAAFEPTTGQGVGTWAQHVGTALIYPSSEVAAGTAVVAALRAGGRLIQIGSDVLVVGDAKTNVYTVRSETYSAFGVRLAGTSRVVTLTE
jgi:hypothetical protein